MHGLLDRLFLPFVLLFARRERGNGSIPLCLSLNEIGIYGGAARTLGVLLRWGRWEDGVKIRQKQIFEARGREEDVARGAWGGSEAQPGENSSGQRLMWREGCLATRTRSFKTFFNRASRIILFTRFPSSSSQFHSNIFYRVVRKKVRGPGRL